MIAPGGAHHARPRLADAELAALIRADGRAVVAQDAGFDAEERSAGAAGLERVRAGQRRDEMAAGLGLPPSVHDRALLFANDLVIPHPSFGIDRFADGAKGLE